MTSDGISRRTFVGRLPLVGGGIACGLQAVSLTACAGTPYVRPTTAPEGLSVPLDAPGTDGGVLVQSSAMERPVYLRRDTSSGEWVALLASCTHRGCQPDPVGERLVCPCHGSEFSLMGEVLEGPAERPLRRYPVTREGDRLVIHIDGRRP